MTNWIHVSSTSRPKIGRFYNVTIALNDGKRFVTTLMFMGEMGEYEWDTFNVIFLGKSDYTITHFSELPEPAQDIPSAETQKTLEDTENGIGLTEYENIEEFFKEINI
jgi:hypothetical protein